MIEKRPYNDYVTNRVVEEANYYINNKSTIRETAKKFGVCKSTVALDFAVRLPNINKLLYDKVYEIININAVEKALRGGLSTKEKYYNKIKA